MNEHSITYWFDQLQLGDANAASELWDRFFGRLVRYARGQMGAANRRVADEEDIAAGVMAALCHCADQDRLPQIENRDDLWRMLLTWTRHDITDQVRAENRLKRGGGKVRGDSVFELSHEGLDKICSEAEPADVLLELNEQCHVLLSKLETEILRTIAKKKLHGYSNEEIASLLDVSPRTIERKLNLIRSRWS